MQRIVDTVAGIADIWANITQGLNDVGAWNLLLDLPQLLDDMTPKLIDSWTSIKEATERYMDIITGVKMTVGLV